MLSGGWPLKARLLSMTAIVDSSSGFQEPADCRQADVPGKLVGCR